MNFKKRKLMRQMEATCTCKQEGHQHCHCHHRSLKDQLLLIGISTLLLIGAVIVEHVLPMPVWMLLLVYLIPYLTIGLGTLKEAAEGLARGNVFNEHFLMGIATIGALSIGFVGGDTEFAEAVFVMLFFQVGELFESIAEEQSRKSIAHLMDIRPDSTTVERNGRLQVLAPELVAPGEVVLIKPGEKIPLDGILIEGSSTLNTVALTGESAPRPICEGDEILSGCINLSNVIRVRITKTYSESTVSKIIDLVENASEKKSRSENFITRFARIYTPIVVLAALLITLVPLCFGGTLAVWLNRALMFLVVSCPCALVLSVPLTFFGGIGGASRKGILIKGANYIDALARTDTVVFDKTGTLTHGRFAVESVHPVQYDSQRLVRLAALAERYSTHPIAAALRAASPNTDQECIVTEVEEIAGQGIRARVDGEMVCVGNTRMMDAMGAAWNQCHHTGPVVHVAINGQYAGHIAISDTLKENSASAIRQLRALGVKHIAMLTGDREPVAQAIAHTIGIDEYRAELMPADKVNEVEKRLRTMPEGAKLAFVGDGINDAPVLARADIGIAMGGLGSDAAIEAADVVLMDDNPDKISLAIRIARRTLRIANQNVWFAIAIKLLILMLAATGNCTMWLAVFGDVGVTVLAVLNAMRTLTVHE